MAECGFPISLYHLLVLITVSQCLILLALVRSFEFRFTFRNCLGMFMGYSIWLAAPQTELKRAREQENFNSSASEHGYFIGSYLRSIRYVTEYLSISWKATLLIRLGGRSQGDY
jgi:hypothetical protein